MAAPAPTDLGRMACSGAACSLALLLARAPLYGKLTAALSCMPHRCKQSVPELLALPLPLPLPLPALGVPADDGLLLPPTLITGYGKAPDGADLRGGGQWATRRCQSPRGGSDRHTSVGDTSQKLPSTSGAADIAGHCVGAHKGLTLVPSDDHTDRNFQIQTLHSLKAHALATVLGCCVICKGGAMRMSSPKTGRAQDHGL